MDKSNNGKLQIFIKSTKLSCPTGNTGASSIPLTVDGFMYIEISVNFFGQNVLICCERTDIIQISNIKFFIIVFLQKIANQWEDLGFDFSYKTANGIQKI